MINQALSTAGNHAAAKAAQQLYPFKYTNSFLQLNLHYFVMSD